MLPSRPANDPAGRAPVDARQSNPRANILIVDDHPANLVALEAILSPLGHDLSKASSGDEALRHILHRDFALILLDVQMAGMNGFETAGLIKQHPRCRHIPIIFITAVNRDAAHVFHGYAQGAVDYLVKPFDPDILRSKVQVFVDLYLKGEKLKIQERILREREREALERKSQERYRRLLDAMPQCMWAADTKGQVDYWNRAGLEYCGLDASEVTQSAFWECLHAEDRADARTAWERGLRSGTGFERQVRLRRAADGSYRWHLARAVPERGDDGAVVGWIATATDIDDQKQAEEALRKAVVLRDDFLSVASHELRTPLTSLKLEVANLIRLLRRDDNPVDARVTTKVERIDAQSGRLHRLIDELLDVSRIAAGRLELKIEEVDLSQVAEEVRARFVDEATRQGCTLTVQTPPAATGLWDRGRLDQVLTNLISNAIKYGDGKPIEVTVDVDSEQAVIGVRDHGVGIPPAEHARIFGRFERAASSRNYGGIGLGLWIVRQIVEALGGQVSVESRPTAGSLFTVTLPRAAAVGDTTAKRASVPAQREQPA